MDILSYNRDAWDRCVAQGNRWTVPVTSDEIAAARRGEWSIILTPRKPVPRHWFSELDDIDVLALGSGGGQQGPILAACGAHVTVFDNSPAQLAQDRKVAERDVLTLETVQGDMADLSRFDAESFDNAGGDGEEESESDYDEEGGNRKGREASYDPDFDN